MKDPFLTISVYGKNRRDLRPGDTDPWVAGFLRKIAATRVHRRVMWSPVRAVLTALAERLNEREFQMEVGSNLTWWVGLPGTEWPAEYDEPTTSENQTSGSMETEVEDSGAAGLVDTEVEDSERTITADSQSTVTENLGNTGTFSSSGHSNSSRPDREPQDPEDPGNMDYECDSSLGAAPEPMDCEKLSWSGFPTPDNVENLQPETPKFFSQGRALLFSFATFRCNYSE